MEYRTPQLTLVGAANTVVLSGQGQPVEPVIGGDNLAELEAEW